MDELDGGNSRTNRSSKGGCKELQSPLAILVGQNPALFVRYSKGSGIESDRLGIWEAVQQGYSIWGKLLYFL